MKTIIYVELESPQRYDHALHYAKHDLLPPDAPRPLPTSFWQKENIALLERFQAWLLGGGASEHTTNLIYLPIAGHVLGLNIKPYEQITLDEDLDRALVYMQSRGISQAWAKLGRNGLNKFRRFLRFERGLGEVRKITPFDVARKTEGLPAWLVNELERFQHIQQRNWRTARLEARTRGFWVTHLNVWRFLCEQKSVCQLADLKRQHVLDYVDQRLNQGYAPTGVNYDLRSLHSFLLFLQEEGHVVPNSILRIPTLKTADPLPKYLTDEQVQLLRDDLKGRVNLAGPNHQRRDALMDRAFFYLLWQCGLRSGEVEELRLEDLDLCSRKISVRDGKERKDRTVYATDTTVHALQEYLAVRGEGSGDHVFLFLNAPLNASFILSRLKSAGKRVGVKVYPHRLRHTCATQLLNAGCRITSIQRFLGHKKLNTTMIYARAHDKNVAEDYFKAMERVEQRFERALSVLSHLTLSLRWMANQGLLHEIADLTPQAWYTYMDYRFSSGISPRTLNSELSGVKHLVHYLQEQEIKVCERFLLVDFLEDGSRIPKDVPLGELRRLQETIQEEAASQNLGRRRAGRMDLAWFLLMLHSGLRSAEVRNLKPKNIEWEQRRLRIEQSKGLKDRLVYLSQAALDSLKSYLEVRGQAEMLPENVFISCHQAISKSYLFEKLRTYGRRCGVHATPHQLRHSCATLLLNAGAPVVTVQAILGHKNVDTTLIYARLYDGTIAADYYRAMLMVERQLALPEDRLAQLPSIGELLALVDSLQNGTLNPARSEIVWTLRAGLTSLAEEKSKAFDIKELLVEPASV